MLQVFPVSISFCIIIKQMKCFVQFVFYYWVVNCGVAVATFYPLISVNAYMCVGK